MVVSLATDLEGVDLRVCRMSGLLSLIHRQTHTYRRLIVLVLALFSVTQIASSVRMGEHPRIVAARVVQLPPIETRCYTLPPLCITVETSKLAPATTSVGRKE